MKILAVNWLDQKNPQGGGAEIHFEEILQRVVSWGHDVTLVSSGFDGCKTEEQVEGIEIRRCGRRMTFNFVAPFLINRLLAEGDYDLIVEDVNKIPFYLPLFSNLPHLVVIPHLFGKSIYQETNFLIASYVYLAEKPIRRVYQKSNFLVISQSTRDDLIKRGIDADKIGVAECGVDHDFYTPDNQVERFDRPTLIYLGRVKKYKSVHHIIEALPLVRKEIPDVRLIIVGSGDYLDSLKSIAANNGLSDVVTFTGFVSAEKKRELLRKAHISIYPSPKEGWGITNIEANACGTPVVASNVPGLKDSVNLEKSGLLYEYGNLEQMASQIVRMLRDRELYRSLVDGAIEWAGRFTWDDCAKRSFAWFEKTVKEWRR